MPQDARTSGGSSPRWTLVGTVLGLVALVVVAAVVMTRERPAPTPPSPGGASDGGKVGELIAVAEKLRLSGDTDKCEAVLREAARTYGSDQRVHIVLAEMLVEKASHAEGAEAADAVRKDAYAEYERALATGARDAKLEFVAGTLASRIGMQERAVEHYAAAQAADRTDYRFPLYLAQVQLKLGGLEEAKANLLLAGKLKPDEPVVWGTLADIAVRENKASIALQHVRRARELEPRSTLWRVIEARALKRDNKPEEALQVLIGLDESERAEPGVVRVMAECYGMLDRPGEAAELYAKAAAGSPSDGELALEAARWMERAGRPGEARALAERAAMLAVPGAKEIAERLGAAGEK